MKRQTLILIAIACAIAPVHFARAESVCPATISVEQRGVCTRARLDGFLLRLPDCGCGRHNFRRTAVGTGFAGARQRKAERRQPHSNLAITEERSRLLAAVQLCEHYCADLAATAGERLTMRRRLRSQHALRRRRQRGEERELQIGIVKRETRGGFHASLQQG